MRMNHSFMQGMALIIVISIVFSLLVAPATGEIESSKCDSNNASQSTKITSFRDIEYRIVYLRSSGILKINGCNPSDRRVEGTGIDVTVDKYSLFTNDVTFEPGETKSWEINVTYGLDVLQKPHYVYVSTFGDSTRFNFTKEIDPSNPGPIPTPYIEEVRVTNGTIDGEPSAVAKVTVVNPSIQTYPTKLAVHTLDTDGSFYPASAAPGGKNTITVELLDERGTQIAGEARLYAGNLSKGNGAMQQVGFVGRAGEDTKTWNETYEPVKAPWRDEPYEYHNATYEENTTWAERLSGGYEVFGVPVAYLVGALLVGLALVRRWR